MQPAYAIDNIVTPKQYHLRGLWFGPKRPKNLVIWIHGLGSSAFSRLSLYPHLVGKDLAVLAFNNRGTERVSGVKRVVGKKTTWKTAGSAHEIFSECVDDIQGAVGYAKRMGAKNIYLAGHSTGCQKSVYWASKTKVSKGVRGIILLAPISDYADQYNQMGDAALKKALSVARELVRKRKGQELLTSNVSKKLNDAQRFISLYSGNSAEEIFTYWDSKRNPRALRSVKLPVLVLLAEKDEYGDRPAQKIGDWFAEHLKIGDEIVVVPRVGHSFKGAEKGVAKHIKKFIRA